MSKTEVASGVLETKRIRSTAPSPPVLRALKPVAEGPPWALVAKKVGQPPVPPPATHWASSPAVLVPIASLAIGTSTVVATILEKWHLFSNLLGVTRISDF